MNETILLSIENLRVTSKHLREVQAIHWVNLKLEKAKHFALVGEVGSGKCDCQKCHETIIR